MLRVKKARLGVIVAGACGIGCFSAVSAVSAAATTTPNGYFITVNPTSQQAGQSVTVAGNGQYNTAPFSGGHCNNLPITVTVTYYPQGSSNPTSTTSTSQPAGSTTTTSSTTSTTSTTVSNSTTTTSTTTTPSSTTTTTQPAATTRSSQSTLGTANATGNVSGSVTIPASAAPSSASGHPAIVQASCQNNGVTYESNQVSVNVNDPSASAQSASGDPAPAATAITGTPTFTG